MRCISVQISFYAGALCYNNNAFHIHVSQAELYTPPRRPPGVRVCSQVPALHVTVVVT